MFSVEGDDVEYEIFKNKIIIYLEKVEDTFVPNVKAFSTHYLEQTLDDNDNVTKEVIKKNPHYVNLMKIDYPDHIFY